MRAVILVSCLLAAVSANFHYDYGYGDYAPYPQPPQQYSPTPQESNPAEPLAEDTNSGFHPQPTFDPRRVHQNTFHKHANPYFPSFGGPRPGFHNARMQHAQRSSSHGHQAHHGHGYKPVHKPSTRYVPVVVKKKTKKNRTILTTHRGFYIPNGTQMFGKFADLKSCEKACELTPTCFAGDFNPWVKKCYAHGNTTACGAMKTHKQITHFKKTVCTVTNTPRGLVTLGIQLFKGVKVHDIKDLASCIKKCTTLGGGIAAKNSKTSIGSTPQLCFGIDFDFSNHNCFLHIRSASSYTTVCAKAADTITTSTQAVAKATSVNILICPLAKAK